MGIALNPVFYRRNSVSPSKSLNETGSQYLKVGRPFPPYSILLQMFILMQTIVGHHSVLFLIYVHMCGCVCHVCVETRGWLAGISSFLPPCGYWGQNSNHQSGLATSVSFGYAISPALFNF